MAAKTNALREKADSIFNKRYKVKSKNDKYSLPEANAMFSGPGFTIEPLIAIKNSLNATKNLLNSKDIEKWRKHTSKTNPCGLVVKHLRKAVKPELCTQAWAKFYEILSSCDIIPSKCIENREIATLHLCEAPGAFIASLNHYIKSNVDGIHWKWLASTLNPFYEGNDTKRMISGERFIIETLGNWNFGESNDGDLLQWDNLECLLRALGSAGKVDIVTADGSISCADEPDKQEVVIGQLLYCEVVAALVNLVCGGSLVIKMFTMFEHHTIGILFLLCCLFEEVEIIKPGTSKPGNSEVYCVCRSFAGPKHLSKDLLEKLQTHYTPLAPERTLFPRECLPSKFIEKIVNCAKTFSEFQTNAINRNIELFENFSKGKWKFLTKLRNYLAEEFVYRFDVQHLEQELFVVSHVHLDGTQLSYWPESAHETYCNSGTHHTGSYVDRVAMSKLGWHERVVFPQDEMRSLISEDNLVNEILNSVPSIEWLKGVEVARSDVQHWSIALGKPIEVTQSSRFCPPTLISQLNEAKANVKLLHTPEGRQLIETLECLAEEKAREIKHGTSLLNIVGLLQKCGVLGDKSRHSFIVDISGNGRFVSELLQSGVCYREQCIALLCQTCAVECNDAEFRKVLAKSCLNYDASEVEKLKSFGCEEIDGNGLARNIGQEGIATDECIVNNDATSGNTVKSTPKSIRIILGSVPNQCRSAESFTYDELSNRANLLNQIITAARLLQQGDCFVCEVSDTLTQFTVGLIYILHLLFKEIALISPMFCPTSKQFLVCRDFVNSTQSTTLLAHIEKVSEVFINKPLEKDIIGFLPISQLFSEEFYKYIRTQSTNHVREQLYWIVKCEQLLLSKH